MGKRIWMCLLALICFAGYRGQQSVAAPERPTTLAMLAEGYGCVIDPFLVGKVPMYDGIQAEEKGTDMKITDTVTITADFDTPVTPPPLKKIAIYNAGCIQLLPITSGILPASGR